MREPCDSTRWLRTHPRCLIPKLHVRRRQGTPVIHRLRLTSAGLWTSSRTDQEPHPQVASYPPGMLWSFIFSEKMLVCDNQFCIPNNKPASHWKVRLVLLYALSGWWQAIFSLASFHSGLDQTSSYKKCISGELWCRTSYSVMIIAWYTFLTSSWWRSFDFFDF